MFDFKYLITVICLVVNTIVLRSSAEKCQELLSGKWFENKSLDGLINFKKSFRDLSYAIIVNHFRDQPPGEQDPLQIELQKDMFVQYFFDLEMSHGLILENIDFIDEWCDQRADKAMKSAGLRNNYSFKEYHFNDCRASIIGIFKLKKAEIKKPSKIFKILYEDWTISDLTIIGDDGSSTSGTNLNRNYVITNNYPLEFFNYYGEFVSKGVFRTIEAYCMYYGYRTVQEKLRID